MAKKIRQEQIEGLLEALAGIGAGSVSYIGAGSIIGGGTHNVNQATNSSFSFDLSTQTKADIALGVTAHGWGNHSGLYAIVGRTITAGNGLTGGGDLSANRSFVLGTPSAITLSSTNSVGSTTHSHAFTPGGTGSQYIDGTGALKPFPTIPTVNNGTLTMTTGTGLSGGVTFGANQASNATFSVSIASGYTLPTNAQVNTWNSALQAVNLSLGTRTATTMPINNSGGTNVILPTVTTSLAGLMGAGEKMQLDTVASWGRGLRVDGNGAYSGAGTWAGNIDLIRNASMYASSSASGKPFGITSDMTIVNFTSGGSVIGGIPRYSGFDLGASVVDDRLMFRMENLASDKKDWYEIVHSGNISSMIGGSFITTNTNQTGLSGDKTTSGSWTYSGTNATPITIERTNSTNTNIRFINQGGSIYAGATNGSGGNIDNFFVIGDSADLNNNANRWMWVSTTGLVSSKAGFSKTGATNADMLLGSGGHRPVSDFALVSSLSNYVPTLSNGVNLSTTGVSDFNNITTAVRYTVGSDANPPTSTGTTGVLWSAGISGYRSQISMDFLGRMSIRSMSNSVFGSWREVITDANLDAKSTALGFIKSSALPTVNNGQLTLSTGTGLSGSATFTANQAGASSFSVSIASGYTLPTNAQITTWNNKFNSPSGNTNQYVRGDGSLATFPTIPSTANLVPYTGATANVNLNGKNLTNSTIRSGVTPLSAIPASGVGGHHFEVGNSASIVYGMLFGSLGNGQGYIQQGRTDGQATNYQLNLNPNGGRVFVGENLLVNGQIDTSNHGNSSQWKQAYDWGDYSQWGLGAGVINNPAVTTDLFTVTGTGFFRYASSSLNTPDSSNGSMLTIARNASYTSRLSVSDSGNVYFTYGNDNTWRKFITEVNLNTEATSLGFIKSSALSGYVPTSRTITINGQTFDLSANRSWTIATSTPNDGTLSLATGTGLSGSASFSANQAGNSTFTVGIASGYVLPTTAQVNSWNAKGNGTVTSVGMTIGGNALNTNTATITTSGIFGLTWGGTTAQYVRGDGSLATMPTGTAYTAGAGLTLAGTVFSLPVTVSGTGTFVQSVAQNANGITVTMGTPPNTTYTTMSLAELQAGTVTAGRVISANVLGNWMNGVLAGYVPIARTITINGVTQNLSANRSWNVSAPPAPATQRSYDITDSGNNDYFEYPPITKSYHDFGFDVVAYNPNSDEFIAIFDDFGQPYLNEGIFGMIALLDPNTGKAVTKGSVECQGSTSSYLGSGTAYLYISYYRDTNSPTFLSGSLNVGNMQSIVSQIGGGSVEMFSGVIILGIMTPHNTLMVDIREF